MKIKLFILGLSLGVSILSGCNDELSLVGSTIQPGDDKPTIYADTFQMQASTILMDSVYARTTNGSLGRMYDPLYGDLQSDFMCQFYCPEDFTFAEKPAEDRIDSVEFVMSYYNKSWVGDSLTPMRAQVFEVTEPLIREFYTDFDPKEFCNMQISYGQKTYTAYDKSVPDSVRFAVNAQGASLFTPNVKLRFPDAVGQRIYDETIKNPATFKSQDAFNTFFPGIYVTTTFGSGNIISLADASMYIYYRYKTKGSADQDTLKQARVAFSATNEVIQLNRAKNKIDLSSLPDRDSFMYMKTPAGLCTELVLPSKDIGPIIEGRIINFLQFSLKALPKEEWDFALNAPSAVLLLPKDSVKTFFPNNKLQDNKTSFIGQYNTLTRTYLFGNIANILQTHLESTPEKDLVMVAIPVEYITQEGQYGAPPTPIAINNYLMPSGAKLRKDKEVMQIIVGTTKYQDKKK